MTIMTEAHHASETRTRLFFRGSLAMMPLSVAVLPWGLLAGSFAVESGLTVMESQALSAILFAGSAQLVATGMLKAGAGLFSLLLTVFFITSRHFLYSVSMRSKISPMPLHWRVLLGFLLTDELFALLNHQDDARFNRWYAFGAGFSFYLIWNIATLVGIIAGHAIPNLNSLGLDFAIAATFIAIVVPNMKTLPVKISVLAGLVMSVLLNMYQVEGSLVIASLSAMIAGYVTETYMESKSANSKSAGSK
ncbi:AzlC family ABC transporter permease [Vibrio gazogenes]|uniref:4-azaleucine resistance probable transporter AzlC n=1 Tax=Vibrio gazogenes DSM 21264 = NBRC 103151 TaxID=1123492 RepID=A0A1M4T9R2_VIBGA|nr:AzlC family ABC transporter permease [Vibrio gazogenes]USP16050.1 AzlC family ABC transporter permease [Vibrio gazogenes]SHE41249.1 4-azaleucine resistance probable transporter AzlC [Vibrio gazogenes DSM 21264] [Vibrio gazogenes DSM 21264 = NBRC 103151]SJN54297.1 Inner membrane protein YgaZ [Vibrio gazogenes]